MSDKTTKGDSTLRVTITPDHLSAKLYIDPAIASAGLPQIDVITAINQAGVPVTPQVQQAIAALTNPAGCVITPEPVIIATGVAPVDDIPGKIELNSESQEAGATANFYDRSAVKCIKAEDVVATIRPLKVGQDGLDVNGKPLRRRTFPPFRPRLGPNVRIGDDGVSIFATAAGQVKLEIDKIQVDPILNVRGDVDFATGNINFAGMVTISGSVKDLFKVHAGGNIEIRQAVEAAEIIGGGDVVIHGAVVGKEKGHINAAGNMSCKFASNAHIIVAKDMVVQGELNNCHIAVRGQLTLQHGPMLGGRITANKGITCHTIGSPAQVTTLVEAGLDDQLRNQCAKQLPAIEEQRKKVARVRQTIEPLMKNQKNLTASQKEKATELLFEADEVEKTSNELEASLRASYEQVSREAKAEIVVQHMVYSGAIIRFPQVETTITNDLKGPLTFQPQKIDHDWRVVIRRADGRVIPLHSRSVADATLRQLAQVFGSTPDAATATSSTTGSPSTPAPAAAPA